MLTARVIPCLDFVAGRVVKGVQFQDLRDTGDPASLALQYEDQGADEIIMLDVSATAESRSSASSTVADVRKRISIPLTVGGGVRSVDDVQALLESGADKVSINTAAVANPMLICEASDRFGKQCIVIAIDARKYHDDFVVVTNSGTQQTLLRASDWAMQATTFGAGEVLLTSWDRDGTQSGYDLLLIKEIAESVQVPVIASGGASHPNDMVLALRAGASAVLAASILHDKLFTISEIKNALKTAGYEVRL
ncbi:MAG: imidazole glycerol phosphate synthase subunit HisF [Fimbriimonadales bacterium]|nr:imidazole glycerol phosphate synthase subunit HisF [Fimbriimonadales bacterium]